jgi:polysaccharide export outer membrane protein
MPVRIHGRLRAEWVAVLGACLAAAGCQTSLARNDSAPPAIAAASKDATNAQGTSPFLSMFDKSRGAARQPVTMSRPVALPDGPDTTTVGSWNPTIQRTSAQQIESPALTAPVLATTAPDKPAGDPPLQPVADQGNQGNQGNGNQGNQLNLPTAVDPHPGVIVEGPPPGHHGVPQPAPVAAPREFEKRSYPTYIIEPPDILLIQSTKGLLDQPVKFLIPVGMDGTINLGTYGSVRVVGMTVEEARDVVIREMMKRVAFDGPKKANESEQDFTERTYAAGQKAVSLEVSAYNSKVYYIITDGGGYGATVTRFPATGNETVLDALSQIGGLPNVASMKRIWVARATPGCGTAPQIMPVDWCGIALRGEGATNYQLFPGDRIYVGSDPWVRGDTWIARRLAPVNQILGSTLLGSTTVNSIRNRTNNGTGNGIP